MFFKKQLDQPPKCENCERLKRELWAAKDLHDRIMSRMIKRDTDIINGWLREIDALHLLLEEERKNGNGESERRCEYIHNCQSMNF